VRRRTWTSATDAEQDLVLEAQGLAQEDDAVDPL
jgi:hypothetical protein